MPVIQLTDCITVHPVDQPSTHCVWLCNQVGISILVVYTTLLQANVAMAHGVCALQSSNIIDVMQNVPL